MNRACYRVGIHCSSCPEPLLNKNIKAQVNKQKFSDVYQDRTTMPQIELILFVFLESINF